jgi:hypothetical protein
MVTTMAMQCFAYGSSAIIRTSNARRGDAMNDGADPPLELAEPMQRLGFEPRDPERFFFDRSEIAAEPPPSRLRCWHIFIGNG